MKPISQNYERIFNEYYLEKARRRFKSIYSYSGLFLDEYPTKEKVLSGIDVIKLENFIKSYFLDVIKFKEYHFSIPSHVPVGSPEAQKIIHCDKMLNASKVGAFTAKWIVKNSPIYMVPAPGVRLDKNERHEISVAPYILAANITLRTMGMATPELPSPFYNKLIYHLRFRGVDDRSLILYFEVLDALMKKDSEG